MSNNEVKQEIRTALLNYKKAVSELATVLDNNDCELSNSAPEYMKDMDDFVYEVDSFVEDEIEVLIGGEIIDGENNITIGA